MADDGRQRREDLTVDKTLRFTTSLGFLVSLLAATAWAVQWSGDSDERLTAMEVRQERLERRQDLYIVRRNTQHGVMETTTEDLHHALAVIREAWAAEHGEALP